MTSAFILPDIKLNSTNDNTTTSYKRINNEHDNTNCTVCRREGYTTATGPLHVPKLVTASSRTADEADATLRPAQSPKEALALVVKGLNDERVHILAEIAIQQALLSEHDPSLGKRKRDALSASIADLQRRLDWADTQIYRLHDVLEGQRADELTEQEFEDLTQDVVAKEAEQEKTEKLSSEKKKTKKVTIRSFVDEDTDDESVEARRATGQQDRGDENGGDDETHELPWEGFGEESMMEGDVSYNALEGWRASVH
jgi:hypothetical protein